MKFPLNENNHSNNNNNPMNFSSFNSSFEMNNALEFMNNRLFFNSSLQYDGQMFLLNHHFSIEEDFLKELIVYINKCSLNDTDRLFLLKNIDEFSKTLVHVRSDTLVVPTIHVDYDYNDAEDDYDGDYEEDDSDLDDISFDLENMILDEMETDHFINSIRNIHHDHSFEQ